MSQFVNPTIATSVKWKFYNYQQDRQYGVNLYDGEELTPCVFDTLLTRPMMLVLQIPKEYLLFAEKDTFLYNQGNETFECISYTIDAKQRIMQFNPYKRFVLSLDVNSDEGEKREIHQCALKAHKELINSMLMRLKFGDSLSSASIESVRKLETMVAKRADILAIVLSSLIFSALHIHFGFLFMSGAAILAGLEGILYEKQQNIFGVWIVHWVFGVTGTLLCLIDH